MLKKFTFILTLCILVLVAFLAAGAYPKHPADDNRITEEIVAPKSAESISDETVENTVVEPMSVPHAVILAREWYSKQIGISTDRLEIQSITKNTWDDSCLGIYDLGAIENPSECRRKQVSGYTILFTWESSVAIITDEVHVDEAGTIFRTSGTISSTPR